VKLFLHIKPILALFILLIFSACTEDKVGLERFGTITGRVVDEQDLSGIANAQLITLPPTHTVLTDEQGNFEMLDVEPGDYELIVTKQDYFSDTIQVTVVSAAVSQVLFNLQKMSHDVFPPEFADNFFPADAQTDVSTDVIFQWQTTNPGEEINFTLEIFEGDVEPAFRLQNLTDTFARVHGLKFETEYQWHVIAENQAGAVTSDFLTFTTNSFPEVPILYAKFVDEISQIFVTDSLGEVHTQITQNNFHSWRPVANPQRTRIAFLSSRDFNTQLYTMTPEGTDIVRLTNIPTGGYYNKGVGFAWLPDGERLVFSSYNRLYIINKDGTGLTHLTSIDPRRHFREVDWSPANDKIVTLTMNVNRYEGEMMIMNTDGSGKQVFLSGLPGALENPVFSPDGQRILYTYDVSGHQSAVGRQLDARIFEYNRQTGESTDLSSSKPPGTNDLGPRYLGNGENIVFINTRNVLGSQRNIWIMPSDTLQSDQRIQIVEDVEFPDW